MENYLKAREEFNQKLDQLKKKMSPSIYTYDLPEIVLYEKLLELQEQINTLKATPGAC